MTLKNLADIGRLKPHDATAKELERLLESAAGSLADAKHKDLQAISRFDLAYKSVMQSALAALIANGYRPSTSEPGHQQTTIQTLPKTIGVQPERVRLLDGFRRARNLSDYEGNPPEDRLVEECLDAAERLLADVRAWIKRNRPDLT